MFSGIKGFRANQTNSLYISRADDIWFIIWSMGNDYWWKNGCELVKNSCDKNTINNYNEFIGKKDSNSLKKNNIKIMDYYKKKELNIIPEENKDKESNLSIIPSTPNKNSGKRNNGIKNFQQELLIFSLYIYYYYMIYLDIFLIINIISTNNY